MNKKLNLFLLVNLIFLSSYGQKLTLNDLTQLCSKQNWENVNQKLLLKGWTYYDSEKGNSEKYNTITWSFNKESYSDKAQAWFYLFTFEGFPNKISYSVFNKESYSVIRNSLSSKGFKLIDSEIGDNEVISTYSNSIFILEITTERREDDEWSSRSITAYVITLIKKSGIYDPDNGPKKDYYYGDVLKAEYILKDGELEGEMKVYFTNGKLKKTGFYRKGKANGKFVEYDEDGLKTAEYTMKNDEMNGLLTIYKDSKFSHSSYYIDDKRNGSYVEYYYFDGELVLKEYGTYLNDYKEGTWKMFVLEEGSERLLTFTNYSQGVKDGLFQKIQGDSLIIGNYNNEILSGEYKVFRDISKMLFGGIINTDTSDLVLIKDGFYYDDLKSGNWKNYDITGTLRNKGIYSKDFKTGEWKYYYGSYSDKNGGLLPYSGKLYLIENYSVGKLNGKCSRFSYLDEEKYPCSEDDKIKYGIDSCLKQVYKKIFEIAFYKNNELTGLYELRDSLNLIVAKGNYSNGLRTGDWVHRYLSETANEESIFIYEEGRYSYDKRNGTWVQYVDKDKTLLTFNYYQGKLHGTYTVWNSFNKPQEIKKFKYGKFIELLVFDSLGISKKVKYEIFDEKNDGFKCRKTKYLKDGLESQVYWLKKEAEIDHHWFELTFLINTSSRSGDKGYKSGEYKLLNRYNKPLITGSYLKEEKIGLWTYYYYDQSVKIESNYARNMKQDEKYYLLNGELFSGEFIMMDYFDKEVRKIKNGLRHGKTLFIDTQSNYIKRKETYKEGVIK